MVQRAQIVDITKSYLPGDPNSFVQNLVNTDREDGEEKTLPLVPFEGYNFLPTSYGYKSYFGTNSLLDIDALPSRCQYLFTYQLPNYQTRFIALCEDGIWVCNGNVAASAWTHSVVFDLVTPPTYDPLVYQEWTHCIIENVLYMYQQGRSSAWKTAIVTNELAIQTHTPTFLNMAGQMGIFRAGTRLGFWDSANSVSWSSNLDLTDFTPSLENLAGNRIFGAVVGRIVTIKSHGEGFIVYSTKSVVGATFMSSGSLMWDAKKVFDNTGVSYSRAVTVGKTDNEHFMFGTSGIYTIGKYNALVGKYEGDAILPEVYDYLKESRDPVYLSILQDRYLCFSVISSDYIYGRQSFYTGVVNPQDVVVDWYIPSEDDPVPTYELLPEQLWEIILTEMNGDRTRSRTDNRKWIPLYTSTYDRMDDRYQAFHTSLMGETVTGLPNYSSRNAGLAPPITDSMIVDCQPPLASSRFGEVRSFAGIRAFEGSYGATQYRTNETLIIAQEEEWDEYKKHALANKDYIQSLTGTLLDIAFDGAKYESGWTVEERDVTTGYVSVATRSLGSFITGSGNNDWLVTAGPAADAAKEVILRRIFNKAYDVTERVAITYGNIEGGTTLISSGSELFPGKTPLGIFTIGTTTYFQIYDGGVHKTYTINGNPALIGSYTYVGSGTSPSVASFSSSVKLGCVKVGAYYYTSISGSPYSQYVSTDLRNWTSTGTYGRVGKNYCGFGSYIYKGEWAGSNLMGIYRYPVDAGGVIGTIETVTTTGDTLTSSNVTPSLIEFNSKLYMVIPSSLGFKIFSSTNGTAWTQVYTTAAITTNVIDLVVHNNKLYILLYISGSNVAHCTLTTDNVFSSEFIDTESAYCLEGGYVVAGGLYLACFKRSSSIWMIGNVFNFGEPVTQSEVTTYTVDEVSQNAGYSECRMTVTHWDLIEPGLYGDYTLIQRVAASAMTPKVWDNHFPDDRADRDNTWSYSVYSAKKVVDLAAGTIGRTPIFISPDPDATSNPLETGLTSKVPDFTMPGATFLLQTGSIEAAYPTFTGALIFDLQLKKWGKYKGDHKLLVETTPVNANILDTITYTDLGTNAGILNATGEVRVFDSTPADSWMRWGKLGYYRLGMTNILEIKASNRTPLNTSIMVDSSMDGKILDMTLSESFYYWSEVICEALPDISARWHTVKISGNYDLTGLEIRATITGRR